MANEVVAHYLDGRVVKGITMDVDLGRPLCHIRTPANGTLEVKLTELKALFLPADSRSNNVRVLVNRAAVKRMSQPPPPAA